MNGHGTDAPRPALSDASDPRDESQRPPEQPPPSRSPIDVPLPAIKPAVVDPVCGPPAEKPRGHLYYRKEKLRGACWEYRIEGGWVHVPEDATQRNILRHRFSFYRPREFEIPTAGGTIRMSRSGAEQWFFPDRWFSLLRFISDHDETIGYYVNFSYPLRELKPGYYHDLDLELDLWLNPDGSTVELDRPEFDEEVERHRIPADWAACVETSCRTVAAAARGCVADFGPDLDDGRDPGDGHGLPRFILRV